MAGAGFRGPVLIFLLNITLNEKLSSHSLQFTLKYHVFLNSLRAQIPDHTHRSLGPVAKYYTAVGLEKISQTQREQKPENSITEATLAPY